MTKIAFASTMHVAPWGGSEELWSQTAERLARRGGVSVAASVHNWPGPIARLDALERAGGRVHRRRPFARLRRLSQRLPARLTYGWLDAFRPDLMVVSQGYHTEGTDWVHACWRRGIRFALITQSVGECAWPEDGFAGYLAGAFEGAEACYFVSQGNLEFVRRQLATPLEKARIVRNPFNVPYDAAPSWPAGDEPVRLACVGRLYPAAKGQDILFDVLRSDKWRGRRLEVTLFGDGPNAERLRALKEMYRLDNVRFGGFTSDVAALWRDHHALVLTSRHEGLPLVVVEAMLCGRPCIVTDVAGNTELIEDNVSGFVAAAPNTRCVDEALERAWDRRACWREMGQAAALRVRALVPPDPVQVLADDLLRLAAA